MNEKWNTRSELVGLLLMAEECRATEREKADGLRVWYTTIEKQMAGEA